MPIVPSRSRQIQELIASLAASRAADRESAVARLTLLGERGVAALATTLRGASAAARLGAAEALSRLVAAGRPAALGPLAEALCDTRADDAVRMLALDTVAELPEAQRNAILARVPPAKGVLGRRLAELGASEPGTPGPAENDPVVDAEALLASFREGPGSIPELHAMLVRLGERPDPRAAEVAARLHEALSGIGSRIALYDLRERLEARPARDVERLLKAARAVADASFVPTLARLAVDALPLVPACADALGAIIRREKLKKSHRAVKAVRPEHRAVFESLWARARR